MRKRAVAIRHLAFEDLGAFEDVLKQAGYSIRYHDIGLEDFSILRHENPEVLFVLGGPIGAYEEDKYPFLLDELRWIEDRLKHERPLFGICLGAQLMARALGSRVYPGPAKEIGFGAIDLTEAGAASCLSPFQGAKVLHWHGDTFDLPTGAVRLASTSVCENQAFSYGENAIAVQFHPEAGSVGFERWLIGHTVELSAAGIDVNMLRTEWKNQSADLEKRAVACAKEWIPPSSSLTPGAGRTLPRRLHPSDRS